MEDNEQLLRSEKSYRSLARSFRYYKFAALALCLMFIVGGLIVFRDEITVENFRYLIRYLDTGSSSLDSTEAVLEFDAGEASGSKAQIYKNDLVLINRNNFEIFDFHHGKIFNDTFSMTNPSLSVSDVHTLVYDMGGKRIRLYNSFSLLKEAVYDYPIICADTGNGGRYGVATSEKNYHCAVYVYNSAHDRVFRWLSADKYLYDLALDDSSDRLSIATVKAEGGDFVAELHVFSSGDQSYEKHYSFPSQMPLKTHIAGKYAHLLTDRALHSVDLETGELLSVSFDYEKLSMFYFSDTHWMLVLSDNTVGIREQILIGSAKGELLRTEVLEESIVSLGHFGDCMYLLTEGKVLRLRAGSSERWEYPVEPGYQQMCVTGEQAAVLIGNSSAKLTMLKTYTQQNSQQGDS